ncbi:MAG: DUF389 domain-containing protein [Jatrophihabitans sp.]|uniref:DUF389 domain-containing protein n=1 Tax=Jatrophihabitans sp. TaxID=1932789 RepID=UPI003F8018E3
MLHLRVVCSEPNAEAVLESLRAQAGVVAIRRAGETSDGVEITADLARESGEKVFDALRALDVFDSGMASLEPLDTAVGTLVDRAEEDAPGEGADALIWTELVERTGEDSTLTATFLAFMVLATLLAAIGVVTDSQITIVGAMVVGPEFGPLAALSVALLRRQAGIARRAAAALFVGFPAALVVTALLSALARVAGLISPQDVTGAHRETEFIYHPGWFSLITALVAGTAGMLSLMSSKSAALVGVFISVTTIPAAGNAAVAGVLGQWGEMWRSLAQLAINLVGIVLAGVATLAARHAFARARAHE